MSEVENRRNYEKADEKLTYGARDKGINGDFGTANCGF